MASKSRILPGPIAPAEPKSIRSVNRTSLIDMSLTDHPAAR